MNQNNTHAGVDAGNMPGSARADRVFLSINGELQGPLTREQLITQPKTLGGWVWQPGQKDWSPWTGGFTVDDNAHQGQPAPAGKPLQRLLERGRAARTAASLEVQNLRAQRAVQACRDEVGGVYRAMGEHATQSACELTIPALIAKCKAGTGLLQQVNVIDGELNGYRRELERVDPKSPAAARIRGTITRQTSSRAKAVAELVPMQVDLGRAISKSEEAGVLPIDLLDRLDQAKAQLASAIRTQKDIDERLVDANRRAGVSVRVLVGVAAVLVVAIAVYTVTRSSETTPAVALAAPVSPVAGSSLSTPINSPAPAEPASGLNRDQLTLVSQLVTTSWQAWRPGSSGLFGWTPTPDAQYGATGSAGVAYVGEDGMLGLVTNRHVLCLDALMEAKANGDLAIKQFAITVKFPSGKLCPVLLIGHDQTDVDLAYLYVDGRGLRAGVDYVPLPLLPAGRDPRPGDPVVAVGNPAIGDMTFENTQTFGHVSGVRPEDVGGVRTDFIQTDAAINQGNSGGPLLLRDGEQHYWIGVNTLAIGRRQGYHGLNFAIDARRAVSLRHVDFPASPQGVAACLTQLYGFPVGVYQP